MQICEPVKRIRRSTNVSKTGRGRFEGMVEAAPSRAVCVPTGVCATLKQATCVLIGCNETRELSLMSAFLVDLEPPMSGIPFIRTGSG